MSNKSQQSMKMSNEHEQICLSVLDKLKSDKVSYSYFQSPAIDSITDVVDKRKYQELIHEPRDLELIRNNLLTGKYMSIGIANLTIIRLTFIALFL